MTTAIVVIAIVLVVALVAVWSWRRDKGPDGVATFRRQIDALGPEARQRVVDEVQRIDERKRGRSDGP